jgi:hypothetical protein
VPISQTLNQPSLSTWPQRTRPITWSSSGGDRTQTSTLHSDNQSAVALSLDDQFHARAKHIDVRYHFIRDKLADNTLRAVYRPTTEMVADIMTKGLARPLHDKHRYDLGFIGEC